ncbi:MAG: hypothetical protein WBC93_00815 [Sulfitobacter sp.]
MSTSFKAVIAGASFSIAAFASTAAFAEQHDVAILGESYFPTITYLAAGDTVLFTNESDVNHKIVANDASWTSGEILPEGAFVLTVVEDMELSFTGFDIFNEEDGIPNEDGTYDDVADSEGALSFDEAPNL